MTLASNSGTLRIDNIEDLLDNFDLHREFKELFGEPWLEMSRETQGDIETHYNIMELALKLLDLDESGSYAILPEGTHTLGSTQSCIITEIHSCPTRYKVAAISDNYFATEAENGYRFSRKRKM